MAVKPIQLYGPRGNLIISGPNNLIPAAKPSNNRQQISNLQFDAHRLITSLGLSRLRDVSRFLFWKYPLVHGAILEQAELSVAHAIVQFDGEDKEWGEEAETALYEANNTFNIAGYPHDFNSYVREMVINQRGPDGDHWTLLTEAKSGFPMVQVIPAHRIGSLYDTLVGISDPFVAPSITNDDGTVTEYDGSNNPWAGCQIIAGAILNESGAALAYRLYNDPPTSFVDISSASLFPTFTPLMLGYPRGISPLAVAALDMQDVGETRDFEKMAQKAAARITLIEMNEQGGAPPGADIILSTSATTGVGITEEIMEGGVYHYLKYGKGDIKTLVADRPTANQQNFEANLIRGCFYAIEWSADFTLDAARLGGAPSRIVADRINRTCTKIQGMVEKTLRRVDGYRISKLIKMGRLRPSPEWYKFTYLFPSRISADQKYDDDIDRERLKMGGMTYRDWYGKRNKWYLDEFKQRCREQRELKEAAAAEGLTVDEVQILLPNGNPLQQGNQNPATDPVMN